MEDKWKHLRKDLFGNVEPSVELISINTPAELDASGQLLYKGITPVNIESQVANAASVSTGVTPKEALELNKKLIKMGHHVPLEFCTYTFLITGISKACSSQISRTRISSIVSSSRRYQTQKDAFVYPPMLSASDENTVKMTYSLLSHTNKEALTVYNSLRREGVKKGDARYVMPVGCAVSKAWHINARSLRNFLNLRLDPAAEEEIQRVAYKILNIVMHITPSLFEDIEKKFARHENNA